MSTTGGEITNPKLQVPNKFQIPKSKFLIFLLFLFSISPFIYPSAISAQSTDQEKDRIQRELEKIKADRELYQTQVDDLMQQALLTAGSLLEVENQINQTNQKIADLTEKIIQNKANSKKLEKERNLLISDLYIITDDDLGLLASIINPDYFMSLLSGKDESQIVLEGKVKTLIHLENKIAAIKKSGRDLAYSIKNQEDLRQSLEAKAKEITLALTEASGRLSNSDAQKMALEKYFLSLGKIQVRNNRDFISMNSASGETYSFPGGGTEHGLGMSQYGVLGGTMHGITYRQNLAHYYQNTKLGNLDTSRTVVRIGLVLGGGGGRIYVRGGEANILGQRVPDGGFVDISTSSVAGYAQDGHQIFSTVNTGNVILSPPTLSTAFEITYKSSFYNLYRGEIQIVNSGGSLVTINRIGLEEYLKGVVPAEMPARWPVEALKVQAVAARSYSLRQINPAALYDMDDSTRYQVYVGASYNPDSSNQAVESTRGEVLFYGSEIVPCYYHSTSGGWTENNENVWGGAPRPYLRGVSSQWEEASPYWSWSTRTYSRAELEAIFNRYPETIIGSLRSIEIINRGISGRVIAVKITGILGDRYVSGHTFRSIINSSISPGNPPMRSILFGVKS